MVSGLRYRVVGVAGAVVAALLSVTVANSPRVQEAVTSVVPLLSRLEPTVLAGERLFVAAAVTVICVVLSLAPLFKPRPRRILDIVFATLRRVGVAGLALATVGYFDLSSRLPRATLVVVVAALGVLLPPLFVSIRRRPGGDASRAIIVGDDPAEIRSILDAIDVPVLGYVASPGRLEGPDERGSRVAVSDGGETISYGSGSLECLGGFSRLEEVLVTHDVDTAAFAFADTDRGEFFGALAACHDHGVDAKIHRRHAGAVLATPEAGEEVVDVTLEPLDWQDGAVKRLFDVAFAATGLVCLAPAVAVVAAAIKLEDGGPVLYGQERTAELGERFTVYKFRSMVPDAEAATGPKISEEDDGGVDPRVTRVGRFLRRTHLDEIPQLWSILVGDMSVVGPRPERPAIDTDIERDVGRWPQRWFVRPGLTGLAQINDATGRDPIRKLQYDIEYIRRQSFRFDLAIVVRQVWQVAGDVADSLTEESGRS